MGMPQAADSGSSARGFVPVPENLLTPERVEHRPIHRSSGAANSVGGPEKAGVGGSIPSLATTCIRQALGSTPLMGAVSASHPQEHITLTRKR